MSRLSAVLIVLAIWAAIYLPGLGTLEIKGEEGRRILPAVTMLQSGNFIVPHVGSEPYFRKPPLINWLVAGSFALFGQRNEWAARLPSALSVLAVALAFVTVARRSLGPAGSLAASLIWMANFGMIEKGRLIEIEALYVSLCGLALICWLSFWRERRSPWLTWTVPFIFLGLGWLAKGPLHLVFFYAVALGVLHASGELRAARHLAHAVGVVVMLAIFAAWAVPHLRVMQNADVAGAWAQQFSGRLAGDDFKLSGWIMNIPRGLAYFLPWTVLLPFVRRTSFAEVRDAAVAKGLLYGIAISFVAINLVPGSLARYTMPLIAPAAWLTAMLLSSPASNLPPWLRWPKPRALAPALRLPLAIAALACVVIAIYAFALMPALRQREKIRNIAQEINAALPPAIPLYAVDPEYQPFLFYVRDPLIYVSTIEEVPADATYVLVQRERAEDLAESTRWEPRMPRSIFQREEYRKKEVVLFEITAGG